MSKKKLMSWNLGLLLIAALPGLAFAQISVTGSSLADPSSLLGVTGIMCESGPFTVSLGVTGGPQVWDFSALTGSETEMTMTFLNPSETPFADLFPEANVCCYIEQGDPHIMYAWFSLYPHYSYRKMSSSKVEDLGWKGTAFEKVYGDPFLTWKWPIGLGTAWSATSNSTSTSSGGATDGGAIETHETEADAWGTVKVPTGTFECLRVRRHITIISGDETVREQFVFQWLTEDGTEVASLWNVENWEEDPSFSVTEKMLVGKPDGEVAVPGSFWGTIKSLFR
ncbi:MAG: hypothetical protein V1800_11905 [Candidatus Latescibacterota bacterium]